MRLVQGSGRKGREDDVNCHTHTHIHIDTHTQLVITTNFVSTVIGYTALHRQQSRCQPQYTPPLDHQNRKITKSVKNNSH